MQFYTQTLDDIPKEFLPHKKSSADAGVRGTGDTPKTEDLMFIIALLLFLQDEPFFSKAE